MRRLLSLLLGIALVACSAGGGGVKPPPPGAPEYVEAGLVIYDAQVQVSSLKLSEGLRADLARSRTLAQALPLGYRALLKAFWKAVPGAEGYRVYLREALGQAQELASLTAAQSEFTLDDVLPQVDLLEDRSYELGVAAVKGGQTGTATWSWPLTALGAVTLASPPQGSAQPSRPNFVWSNARGNPAAAELDILDTDGAVVLGGMWTSAPLPSSATASQDLPNGSYRWTVINAGSSQAAQDSRTRLYFPLGYMVMSLPAPLAFTVGSGGGGGSSETIIVLRPQDFVDGEATVRFEHLSTAESVAVMPVHASQDLNPDALAFSLAVEGVSAEASPPAAPALLSLQERKLLEITLRHHAFLDTARATVEELLQRGVEPLVQPQVFDRCPPPYEAGKLCAFWVTDARGAAEQISAGVRLISEHAYWFVDERDQGDFSDAELQTLAQSFEQFTVPSNTRYFGDFSDVDGNGKIFIVFSRQLGDELLGYVAPWDYFPDAQTCPDPSDAATCVHSNEGDIFYAATPSAAASFLTRESYFSVVMPSTMTHELKHLIASGARILAGHLPEELWLEEPSAVAAQELAGQGTQLGMTYGFAQKSLMRPQDFRVRYPGRPGSADENASIYGYNFLFLWRIAETLGHEAFWRAWTAGPGVGVANLEAHTGRTLDELMLDWVPTLLFDDSGLLSEYQYQSLNLHDGRWQRLGYQSLTSTQDQVRSAAYHLGRGTGGAAHITIRSNDPKPYAVVVRFGGSLP